MRTTPNSKASCHQLKPAGGPRVVPPLIPPSRDASEPHCLETVLAGNPKPNVTPHDRDNRLIGL